MTTAPTEQASEIQDRVVQTIRAAQEPILKSVKSWTDAASRATGVDPGSTLPSGVPTPQEVVASTFAFAEKLLALQREFTDGLLAAVAPVAPVWKKDSKAGGKGGAQTA